MNSDIKEMVAKYIKLIEMVVKSKGEKSDKTARIKFPNVRQVLDMPYRKIVNYIEIIVEMKRGMESIGIDENA